MILGGRRRDELEAHQVPVRPGLRPNDLRKLDCLVLGCRSNAELAHVVNRHADIDRDAEPPDARVDRQTCTPGRLDEVDLRVESPAPELTARSPVDRRVCATLGENRRQPIYNGTQGTTNLMKRARID